jgi:hypothetical protein
MRIVLLAIEITQNRDTKLYLTKLNIGQIRDLVDKKQLIPDTYNPDINLQRGYQRVLDPNRMKKILNFLESRYKIVLPVLSTSIVLRSEKYISSLYEFKKKKRLK